MNDQQSLLPPEPWYRSEVQVRAVVAALFQLLSIGLRIVGRYTEVSITSDDLDVLFADVSQGLAIVFTVLAVMKRQSSTVQPLTLTASAAAAKAVQTPPLMDVDPTKQKGYARPGLIGVLIIFLLLGAAVAMSGCASTKAAYQAAETPEEYAYVLTEHYAALLREAAQLKLQPTTPAAAIEAMQRADLAAQKPIDSLRSLAAAYQATRSAQTEAELQAAINKAILVIADLVRSVKMARGNTSGALSPLIESDYLRRADAITARASA